MFPRHQSGRFKADSPFHAVVLGTHIQKARLYIWWCMWNCVNTLNNADLRVELGLLLFCHKGKHPQVQVHTQRIDLVSKITAFLNSHFSALLHLLSSVQFLWFFILSSHSYSVSSFFQKPWHGSNSVTNLSVSCWIPPGEWFIIKLFYLAMHVLISL